MMTYRGRRLRSRLSKVAHFVHFVQVVHKCKTFSKVIKCDLTVKVLSFTLTVD